MIRHEAYIDKAWQDHGLAVVVVNRIRDDWAECATFLVDTWCLGVKDAIAPVAMPLAEAAGFVADNLPADRCEPIPPACAKKLIEGAIAYAERLGFAPHRDYRKARKVLSGIDPALCPTEFTFGRDGRPFYSAGADSPERVEKILAILEARCGPDGFGSEYIEEEEEEAQPQDGEIDIEATRAELIGLLNAEPEDVPRFYVISGIVAALQICPVPATPTKVLDALWGPDGKVWDDDADLQHFLDLLTLYWNHVSDLVFDCLLAGPADNANPMDIFLDDFPDDPKGLFFAAATSEWAQGFLRTTELWPEIWQGAVARPGLAEHWEIVRWWAGLPEPGNLERVAAAAEASPPRTLASSVLALARALHPAPPP